MHFPFKRALTEAGLQDFKYVGRLLTKFFDDLPIEITARKLPGLADVKVASFQGDPLVKRETLELVRAYYRITDPSVRKRVFELVKAVAKPASGEIKAAPTTN